MHPRVLDAPIQPVRDGLAWIGPIPPDPRMDAEDRENQGDRWLLVQMDTERVVSRVFGPSRGAVTYESRGDLWRDYLTLEAAQRDAFAQAMKTLQNEKKESARRRKQRRQERIKTNS